MNLRITWWEFKEPLNSNPNQTYNKLFTLGKIFWFREILISVTDFFFFSSMTFRTTLVIWNIQPLSCLMQRLTSNPLYGRVGSACNNTRIARSHPLYNHIGCVGSACNNTRLTRSHLLPSSHLTTNPIPVVTKAW